MGADELEPLQTNLLTYLAQKPEGRTAADVADKLGLKKKKGQPAATDPSDADRLVTGLIDRGLIEVIDAAKEGLHPRRGARYRLSDKGRLHLRPARPDIPDTQLKAQEAFILLQMFRANEHGLTRSQLNDKLRTRTAMGQLEFDVKSAPETVAYHLATLVEDGSLLEERKGNSATYRLDGGRGMAALAAARQHDAVSFTLRGETLNALLRTARGSGTPAAAGLEAPPPPRELAAHDVEAIIDELGSDRFAGKDLIPIHEVRRLVRDRLDAAAAGHPVFDKVLKQMRSEGRFRLIAITDYRDATQQELDDAIPGLNEILFYIDIR